MIIEYKKEYTQKEFDQIKEILNQTKEITIKGSKDEIDQFVLNMLNDTLNYYVFMRSNYGDNKYNIKVC
jgi:hypothetical protein